MRMYAGVGAVVGWFALILQLVLMLTKDSDLSVALRINNFFSYFTILSNILTATTLTVAALGWSDWCSRFFSRPGVRTGIAIYMTVTFAIYWAILNNLWNPQGWEYVANFLLHGAMPVAIVGYWLMFVRHGALNRTSVAWFVAFPIAYAVYTLIRGPVVNWYPYPFIDASSLTTSQLIVNIVVITIGFVVLGFIYVWLDGVLRRRRTAVAAG